MSYLTVTLTARGREPHNLELLPCTVTGSSLFAHAVLGSPEILRGYMNKFEQVCNDGLQMSPAEGGYLMSDVQGSHV